MTRAKVTSKGQITIPADVRRELNLQPGDSVSFTPAQPGVRMIKAGSVIEETAGIFREYATWPPLSVKEMKEMAEEAWAEDAAERYEKIGRDDSAAS